MRLLLTSVFKPFGVDDAYGRKENKIELYHNQVTREQGIFSLRSTSRSFALYTLAENIEVPTAVLDFPTLDEFVAEIKKGYENIGISFIVPNLAKVRKMTTLIRQHSPQSKIILGGHGTAIPELAKLVECDHVVQGDGVAWMREFFGEDTEKPFNHPMVRSSEMKGVLGIRKRGGNGVLITGNGCPMGCKFCCTTHFFAKKYVPYLKTGAEIYETACRVERELGTKSFLIMDENFAIHRERALEFIDLVEENCKDWEFNLFSSANALEKIGLDNIARLNIGRMWIGVESKSDVYEKNKNIDVAKLIKELQSYGIPVLASAILFLEHHTKENIWEDIDYVIGLKPDFIQFMQLSPYPGTKLYEELGRDNRVLHSVPFEEWHGQHQIWFKHSEFTLRDSERILRQAFQKDYDTLGPSLLRVYRTTLQGYRRLAGANTSALRMKREALGKECRKKYAFLPAIAALAPQRRSRELARQTMADYAREFGAPSAKQRAKAAYVNVKARVGMVKESMLGDVMVPDTLYTTYRM